MLELKTAVALKNAGLKWEPQLGDYFNTFECLNNGNDAPGLWDEEIQTAYETPGADIENMQKGSLWLPRLDQLLAEVEKQGYVWDISLNPAQDEKYACWIVNKDGHNCLWGNIPEEAAAQALLWILEQEAKS
jgi:hypothetical protein